VLINTAGFLQSQAESTGQESTEQVSNGIQAVSASINVDSGSIGSGASPEITVQLSPGSDPVDLSTLRYEATGDASAGPVTPANDDNDNTLNEDEKATLTLGELDDGNLSPGDEVSVVFTTDSGAQSTEILQIPDPISDSASRVRL
jgi:flagellin FlaB